MKELAVPIKDKPAFIGDMSAALEEMNPGESTTLSFQSATLKDVKIDGEKATGTITRTVKGRTGDQPIHFTKIDGGWLVDITANRMVPN